MDLWPRTRIALRTLVAGTFVTALIAGCSGGGSTLGGAVTPGAIPAVTQVPSAAPSGSAATAGPNGQSPAPSALPSGASPRPSTTPSGAAPLPSTLPTIKPTTQPAAAPTSNTNGQPENFASNSGISECNPRSVAIGSSSIAVSASGSFVNGVFTARQPATWFQMTYAQASPEPSPFVTISPEIEPTPTRNIPTYIYLGTYTVKNTNGSENTKGCSYLITSVDGSSFIGGDQGNTITSNFVVTDDRVDSTITSSGKVTSYTLSTLSANGGSGSFALDNGMTGTLSLSKRYNFDYPQYLQQTDAVRAKMGLKLR